jgi:hypothetical protein
MIEKLALMNHQEYDQLKRKEKKRNGTTLR